ncbi:MAG: copper resistance protein CopC [Actinomycetota bacterium]
MIRALLGIGVALSLFGLLAPPASAHTAMLRASPDRDAVAGGSIAHIDLLFLDPVTEAAVTLTYNGAPVAGQTTVPDGEVITFTLDQPLTETGRYQVSYEMISFDTDFTTGGFFFTFDPTAGGIARIEQPGSGGGISSTTLVLSGIGLTVLVGVLALFVWRLDGRRRDELLEPADGYGGGGYDLDDYGTDGYGTSAYGAAEYVDEYETDDDRYW